MKVRRSWIYAVCACIFFTLGPLGVVEANSGFLFSSSLCVFIAWIDYLFGQKGRVELSIPHLVFAGLIVSVALSSVFVGEGFLSLKSLAQYLVCLFALIVFSQKEHLLDRNAWYLIFSVVVIWMVILLFLARIGVSPIADMPFTSSGKRLQLTFGNPNYLAALLVCLFPIFLCRAFTSNITSRGQSYWAAVPAVIVCILILATGSRNGLLWLLFASSVVTGRFYLFGDRLHWGFRQSMTLGVGVSLLVVWLLTAGRNTLEKVLALLAGGGESDSGRLASWHTVLNTFSDSALHLFVGRGWGAMYPLAMETHLGAINHRLDILGFKHVHSEPLEWLLEGGILSLILLLVFVGLIVAGLLSSFFKGRLDHEVSLDTTNWQFSIIVSIICICGFSMVSVATRYAVVLLPLMVILALALREIPSKTRVVFPQSTLVRVFLCILLLLNVGYTFRYALSDYYLKDALFGLSRADQKKEAFTKSIQVCPERILPRYQALMHFSAEARTEDREFVDQLHTEIEDRFPNFKNSKQLYAHYVGGLGDFAQAASLLEEVGTVQRYRLVYLADTLFYYQVIDAMDRFDQIADEIVERALSAEGIAVDDASYQSGGLSARIPPAVRLNQPILKYYALAEVVRFIWQQDQAIQVPVFLSLLTKGDVDKILRLADKLEALGR